MTLSYFDFSSPLEFEENTVNTLIIENPIFYRTFISNILEQMDNNASEFMLSEGNSILDFSKNISVITDMFRIDFDTRTINNKVLQEANEVSKTSFDTGKLISELNILASKIATGMALDVTFSEISDLSGVLKLFNFVIDSGSLTLGEKIMEYITLSSTFFGKRLFIILNLKSVLSPDEQEDFFKMLCYKKINVLLIESKQYEFNSAHEKIRIIDKDLCELS